MGPIIRSHKSHMETLILLEEIMAAKFKFKKLSKQFGCYDGSKFGLYGTVTGFKSAYSLRARGVLETQLNPAP